MLSKDFRHMGTKESQVLTVKIGPVLCTKMGWSLGGRRTQVDLCPVPSLWVRIEYHIDS